MSRITRILTIAALATVTATGLSACQSNPDGSLKTPLQQEKKASESSTASASSEATSLDSSVKLEVPAQVRVAHNGWAEVEGTTDPGLTVTIGVGSDQDDTHTEKADANGNFSLSYRVEDKRERVMVAVHRDGKVVAQREVVLETK